MGSGRDAVEHRRERTDHPLEAVQAVLPVLQVGVQILIHDCPLSLRPLGRSVPRGRRLSEVQSGEEIGLPAAMVAFARIAGHEDVVLLGEDGQGDVAGERAGRPFGATVT